MLGGELAGLGFEILYAHDGNEGRETARRLRPDIVMMDIDMPVMDGMEAAERMRGDKETRHTPIIMLTNADLSAEAAQFLVEINVGYLHKSATAETIAARIKEAIGKRTKG